MHGGMESEIAMQTILVLEDDPAVLDVISESLRDAGHCIIAATSAAQARLVLDREDVDLVLADCLMAEEHGNRFAEDAVGRGVSAILMTGDPDTYRRLQHGAIPVLAKPFRLIDLESAILAVG